MASITVKYGFLEKPISKHDAESGSLLKKQSLGSKEHRERSFYLQRPRNHKMSLKSLNSSKRNNRSQFPLVSSISVFSSVESMDEEMMSPMNNDNIMKCSQKFNINKTMKSPLQISQENISMPSSRAAIFHKDEAKLKIQIKKKTSKHLNFQFYSP